MLVSEHTGVEGKLFKEMLTNTNIISYYFNKMETFLSRKNNSSHHDKNSGDRTLFTIDPDLEVNQNEEQKVFEDALEEESESGEDHSRLTPRSNVSEIGDDEEEYYYVKTLFKDFSEPDVIKTGYLLPIS